MSSTIAVIRDRKTGSDEGRVDWSATAAELVEIDTDRDDDGRLTALLEDLLSGRPDVVVLDGDDRLVSRVVTAYRGHPRRRESPLRLSPLETGQFTTVAGVLGRPTPRVKLVERLDREAEAGKLETTRLPALKVSVSSEPSPLFGFNFGAGVFYALFEAYHRSEGSGSVAFGSLVRDAISSGGMNLQPREARVSVDHQPWGESIGFLVASTLERSWLGLDFDADGAEDEAHLLAGESSMELAKLIASSRAIPKFARENSAQNFERLHVDWSEGFVLDGELYEPAAPYVVQVAKGPSIEFVV